MKIPERLRALIPFYIEREIAGQTFKFYPVRLQTAGKLAPMLSTLGGHISVLVGNKDSDAGRASEEYVSDGEVANRVTIQPLTPEMVALRAEQRERAVSGAIDALMAESNQIALAELIVDSLKDDFPRGHVRTNEDYQKFIESVEIPTFVELMQGMLQANSKVFGDLGKELSRAFQGLTGRLAAYNEADVNETTPEGSGPDGSTSKTPSST